MALKFWASMLAGVLCLAQPQEGLALGCSDLEGAYVFAQDSSATYLGFFGSSVASHSIMNSVGTYGSSVSSSSMRNTVGPFGSNVGMFSANNSVTSTPPVIARNGAFVAFLTTNPIANPAVTLDQIDASCAFFSSSPSGAQPLSRPAVPPLSGGGGGTNGPVVDYGFAGLWWNPDRSGEGMNLDFGMIGSTPYLLVTLYSYYPNGGPLFLVGAAPLVAGETTYALDLSLSVGGRFGTAHDPAEVQGFLFGQAEIEFESCSNVLLSVQPVPDALAAGFSTLNTSMVRYAGRQPGHICIQ